MKTINFKIRRVSLVILATIFSYAASAQIEGGTSSTKYDRFIINDDESYHDAGIRLQTRAGNTWRDWNIWNNRQDGKLFFSYWSANYHNDHNEDDIGSYRMTLQGDGKLGIGTTSPSQKLDVNGSTIIRSNLYMDDGHIYDVRGFQLKDWDDNTGGSNDKYRLLARDGAWMFYNGGVVVGNYGNGTWSDVPDGRLIVEEKLGIGKTPSAKLDVNGSAYINGNLSFQAGNGLGMRFWNSDSYAINMGNTSEFKYGPVQDYSIKMNMNNDGDRGWTWGVDGQTPTAALSTQGNMQIAGTLTANRVTVNVGSFPDYVFADDYKLLSIEEVNRFIQQNKHLPNIPAAAEIEKSGMDIGQINVLLTEKVEELTLYTIQQQEELTNLKMEKVKQDKEMEQMKARIQQISTLLKQQNQLLKQMINEKK